MAWILRYRSKLLQAVKNRKLQLQETQHGEEKKTPQITVAEIKNAEVEIVRYVQTECFPEEITSFKTQSTDTTNDNTVKQQARRWKKFTKRDSPIQTGLTTKEWYSARRRSIEELLNLTSREVPHYLTEDIPHLRPHHQTLPRNVWPLRSGVRLGPNQTKKLDCRSSSFSPQSSTRVL